MAMAMRMMGSMVPHSYCQAADDIGGGPCLGAVGNILDWFEVSRSVVFCNPPDEETCNQASDNGIEEANFADEQIVEEEGGYNEQDTGNQGTAVKGLAGIASLFHRTKKVPIIEETMPKPAISIGSKTALSCLSLNAEKARATAAMIEPT